MIRIYFAGFCLLLSALSLMAQKIKDEKIAVQYTKLPASPLDPTFTTYRVTLSGPSSAIEDMGSTRQSLAAAIKLDGFRRMENAPAHFTISVRLGGLNVESHKDHRRTEEKKDKDDKVYKVTYYSRSMVYTQPASYRVYDFQGNVLDEKVIKARTDKDAWKTPEFSTYADMMKYWKKNYRPQINKLHKDNVRGFLQKINSDLGFKYGFQPVERETDQLFILKKHDDEDGFLEAYETVQAAFSKMRPGEPLDNIRREVEPALEFWKKAKENFSPDHKKEKRGYFACLYNLSKVYYWLDDAGAAMTAAEAMEQVDYKDGKSDRFLREVKQLKRLLEVNGVSSRHFIREVANAIPPPTAQELAEQEEAEAQENALTQYDGYWVSATGDTTDGVFYLDLQMNPTLVFGQNSNFYFRSAAEGEAMGIELDQTRSFAFNDRSFEVMNYTPGARGNTESGRHLLEILYDSDRIRVLRHYPFDDSAESEEVEYAYQKKDQSDPLSTLSTEFLIFKQGLSNYFADCADLVALAGKGEFEQDESGIIRAARIYGEMCK